MSRAPYERYYAERGAEGRRSASRPWVPLAGVVVLVAGSFLLASGIDGGPPPRPEAAPLTPAEAAPVAPAETPARVVPSVQAVPTRSTPATTVPRPRSTVRTGTYAVGTDIEAGRWATPGRVATRTDPCSWERSRDGSGAAAASALAHGRFQGPAAIGLTPGEFVEFTGGCTWTRVTGS